jgi:enoyl-CoA hydratase/carnithine racemase
MSTLGVETSNGIAVLKFDNPPVNSIGLHMHGLLWAALARAEADPKSYAEPNLRTLLRAIEDCSKPVIAAISAEWTRMATSSRSTGSNE